MLLQALKYETILAYRRRGELVHPLIFFVVVCTLFPFGIGSDPQVLAPLASGILWVAALLATLLSMDLLFTQDFNDGALEQMELSAVPFYQQVMLKTLVHWLFAGLPLFLLALPFEVDLALREGGDSGKPIVESAPESPAGQELAKVAATLSGRGRGLAGMQLGLTPAGRF